MVLLGVAVACVGAGGAVNALAAPVSRSMNEQGIRGKVVQRLGLRNQVYEPHGSYLGMQAGSQMAYLDARFDGAGLPMVRYRGRYEYNPVTLAQFGLAAFGTWRSTGKTEYLNLAKQVADWLVRNQDPRTGIWEYHFDSKVTGMPITLYEPWGSAMAQGQAISLLCRIYSASANGTYLAAAGRGADSLHRLVSHGGLTALLDGHPMYEEYPTDPPSYTLNGFMFTLIGLYDLGQARPNAPNPLFETGIETLAAALPLYDGGSISLYNLGFVTAPPQKRSASFVYHNIHINLLDVLDTVHPNTTLAYWRDRWAGYNV